MIDLDEAQQSVHEQATLNGFWETGVTVGDKIALIHSEASEALEIHRDPEHQLTDVWERPEDGKPEGFIIELADIVIRCMDLAERFDLSLERAIEKKMAFNATRPYKHGNKRV